MFHIILNKATLKKVISDLSSWVAYMEMKSVPSTLEPGKPTERTDLWRCLKRSQPMENTIRADSISKWCSYKLQIATYCAYDRAQKAARTAETARLLEDFRKVSTGEAG